MDPLVLLLVMATIDGYNYVIYYVRTACILCWHAQYNNVHLYAHSILSRVHICIIRTLVVIIK